MNETEHYDLGCVRGETGGRGLPDLFKLVKRAAAWWMLLALAPATQCLGAVTDSTAYLRGLLAAGGGTNLVTITGGVYSVSGTLTNRGPVDAREAVLVPTAGNFVVWWQDGLNQQAPQRIMLPTIQGNGNWSAGGKGVVLHDVALSEIHVAAVYGLQTGVEVVGDNVNVGCAWNQVWVNYLYNNQTNLVVHHVGAGWANENTFTGGLYSYPSNLGVHVPNVRDVVVTENNCRWYGASFEGSVPDYNVEIDGQDNYFNWCRWENATNVLFGVSAYDNLIDGGRYAASLIPTFRGSGQGDHILASDRTQIYPPLGAGSAAQPTITAITPQPDGNMQLAATGTANQAYALLASSNLSTWSGLSTNTANGAGQLLYRDLAATNHPSRFYRLKVP